MKLKKRQKIELFVLIFLIPISLAVLLNSNISEYEVFHDSGVGSNGAITFPIEPDNNYMIVFSIHNENCFIDMESNIELYYGENIITTVHITKTNEDEYSEYGYIRITPSAGDYELKIVFENENADSWRIKIYKNIPWYKEEMFVISMIFPPIILLFDFGFAFMDTNKNEKDIKIENFKIKNRNDGRK